MNTCSRNHLHDEAEYVTGSGAMVCEACAEELASRPVPVHVEPLDTCE